MAGRHLITEAPKSPVRKYGFAGITSASLVGALVGFVAPAAVASENLKSDVAPDQNVAAPTISLGAPIDDPQGVDAEDVTVSTQAFADQVASQDQAKTQAADVKGGTSAEGWAIAKAAATVTEPAPEPVAVEAQNVGGGAAGVTGPSQAVIPSNGSFGSKIVGIARQYSGIPYVWGGSTPAGFDCSGFTSYVFAQMGVSLPRTADAQRGAGVVVPASQAQPGDLMWWPGHVAIYTGNGMHIGAHRPGKLSGEQANYGSPTYVRIVG